MFIICVIFINFAILKITFKEELHVYCMIYFSSNNWEKTDLNVIQPEWVILFIALKSLIQNVEMKTVLLFCI